MNLSCNCVKLRVYSYFFLSLLPWDPPGSSCGVWPGLWSHRSPSPRNPPARGFLSSSSPGIDGRCPYSSPGIAEIINPLKVYNCWHCSFAKLVSNGLRWIWTWLVAYLNSMNPHIKDFTEDNSFFHIFGERNIFVSLVLCNILLHEWDDPYLTSLRSWRSGEVLKITSLPFLGEWDTNLSLVLGEILTSPLFSVGY